jgi:hypothetical protein
MQLDIAAYSHLYYSLCDQTANKDGEVLKLHPPLLDVLNNTLGSALANYTNNLYCKHCS